MKRPTGRTIALAVAFMTVALTTAAVRTSSTITAAKKPTITVYKDPACGCCKKWIEHLVKNGYRVDAKDAPNMTEIKRTLGVPETLTACHTAVVNGYLIEGHVPAADIDRLLEAVPGMPAGSPGMEAMGTQRYQVLTFDKNGKTKVFASH